MARADLTVNITTTSHKGQFAPKNVVAVWVQDSTGAFIKTIDRWSATRTSHLIAWLAAAGANDIDAVSGATLLDHTKPVLANWDFKNKAGTVVPDGTYTIRMELADSDSTQAAQNDQGTYTFVKNTTPSTQNNVVSGGFTSTITYTPDVTATCNNGKLDPGETCDPSSTTACPASCPASSDTCRPNVLVGSASACSAACMVEPITACNSGDGCCPAGCDAATDDDCAADADNGSGASTSGGCATGAGSQLAGGWLLVLGLAVAARRRRRA